VLIYYFHKFFNNYFAYYSTAPTRHKHDIPQHIGHGVVAACYPISLVIINMMP